MESLIFTNQFIESGYLPTRIFEHKKNISIAYIYF